MTSADDTLAATGGDTVDGDDPVSVPPIARGDVVGRYVVLGEVGRGGMGIVLAAYDPELDRKVAIKLLRRLDGRGRALAQARLQREAQAMARLTHPNVVAVHDVGTVGDQVYVAMEFIEGCTLRQWVAERERTWREVLAVLRPVAEALAAAHAMGLVHRDIKPDNVMIGKAEAGREAAGRVRVMDFGLARGIGAEPTESELGPEPSEASASSSRSRLDDVLTRVGATLGTPAYMAPEQVAGRVIDGRSDQFSYCVMAWEALLGQRPFEGETLAELTYNVLEQRLRPVPRRREVPGRIRRALERGLRVEPAERWPSMDVLLEQLSRAASGRRTRLVAAGLGLAALGLGAGTYWRAQSQLCTGAEAAMAEVWSDEHRERVTAAIHASGATYADDVWVRVGPRLNAWAEAWVAARTDACEATRRRGEQSEAVMDLRMACLARAEVEFSAATRVLAEATPEVLEHAHDIAGGLPQLSRCDDVEALRAEVEPPPPALQPAVAAIREDLAEAAARRLAGAYDVALAAATRAQAALDGLPYEPIATEVWLELGTLHDELGRYAESEQDLQRVRRIGASWHQWEAVRDATLQLILVIGSRQGRGAEALVLEPLADGLIGNDAKASATLRGYLAWIEYGRGDYVAAERYLRDGLARSEDPVEIAQQRDALGGALNAQGRYAEAEAEHRAALAGLRQGLGPQHPMVARPLGNLGLALQSSGKFEEAESLHREALALTIATRGAQHPEVAACHSNLAITLRRQGKLVEAEAELRAAIAIGEATFGPDDPSVAVFHENLGVLLQTTDRLGEALIEQRLALAKLEALYGPDHHTVARVRTKVAGVLFALSQAKWSTADARDEARALADEAAAVYRTAGTAGAAGLEEVTAWQREHP